MKFIQVIEETRDIEEAKAEIEGLIESVGDETTVKNLILCADRDVPGKIVTIVEFESWECHPRRRSFARWHPDRNPTQ